MDQEEGMDMGRPINIAPPSQAVNAVANNVPEDHAPDLPSFDLPDMPDVPAGPPALSAPDFPEQTLPDAASAAQADLPDIPAADLPDVFDI